MVLTLNGFDLALGLSWQWMPSATGLQAELKRLTALSASSTLSTLVFKHQGEVWLASHPPVQTRVHAGALILGLLHPDGVVSVTLAGGLVWMCALQGGLPVVGFDAVVGQDTESTTRQRWLESLGPWPTFGLSLGQHASDALATDHERDRDRDSLAGFLQRLGERCRQDKSVAKHVQTFVLRKTRLPNALTARAKMERGLFLVLALLAGCGLALWAQERWTLLAQAQAWREAAQQQEQGKKRQEALELEKKRALQSSRESWLAQRAALRAGPQPMALWQAFEELRHALPLSANGYQSRLLSCSLSGCEVSWQAKGPWVRTQDQLKLPFVRLPLSADRQPSSFMALHLPIHPGEVRADEVGVEAGMLFLKGDLAHRYTGLVIEEPHAVYAQRPGEPALTNNTATSTTSTATKTNPVQEESLLAHRGTWRLDFTAKTHLLDAAAFAQQLERSPLVLTSIQYTPGQSIEMRGEYVFVQP